MRLIDADALMNSLRPEDEKLPLIAGLMRDIKSIVSEHIQNLPTIEAEPVRHGRWVDRYGGKYANPLYECSECKGPALYKYEVDVLDKGHFIQALSNACPHCGAKMDGDSHA